MPIIPRARSRGKIQDLEVLEFDGLGRHWVNGEAGQALTSGGAKSVNFANSDAVMSQSTSKFCYTVLRYSLRRVGRSPETAMGGGG
jgi:hypothetical protein